MKEFKLFQFQGTSDDFEKNRISYFTHAILLATIIVLTILSVIKIILPPKTNLSDYIVWFITVLFAIIYLMFRKGKVNLAGSFYVITLWLALTILAWSFEGVRDIAIVGYIVAILIAMLITKQWQAMTISFLSIISLWILYYAEFSQIIVPSKDTSLNYSVEFTVILVLVITLIYLNTNSFSSFYSRIHNELEERRLAEKALSKSEERYRDLVENLNDVIFTLDTNGVINYISPQVSKLYGYKPEELLGHPFSEIIYPEDLINLKNDFEATLRNRISIREFRYQNKTGEIRWASTSSRPIFEGENVVGVSGIFSDITERKNAEGALAESKAILTSIIDSTSDLIWSVDSDTFRILTFNKGLEKFFKKENIVIKEGMLHTDILPVELVDKLSQLYSQVLQKGSLVTIYHTTIGQLTLWINLSVLSRDNKPYAISVFAKDITELMNTQDALILAKEKAEESDRLKTAFMNNISHEVRTPLNGILGFAEFVVQPGISEEEKSFYLEVLNSSSERLLNTITNYMDISLIVSGNIKVNKQPVILLELINEIYSNFHLKSEAKNLDFIIQIPTDNEIHSLICDAELLEKSISHLVDNAIKFTSSGNIILGYQLMANEYELFVKDTGSGINREALENIFNSFMQEEVSISRGYEGSGLGLSITKELIKLMGGKIRVDSVKGKGSIFYITFPTITATNGSEVLSGSNQLNGESKNEPLVLIAEDDEISYSYYKTILKGASFKYIIARNGLEAVEICRENPEISIVLMDIKMPVMDGLQATKKIKELRKDLPIIIVTAYVMTGDKEKAIAAGCDEYVTKPLQSDSLISMMKSYL